MLDALKQGLEAAQIELAQAEIALIEATARAESAREGHMRIEAAVAALSGEPPSAAFIPQVSEVAVDGVIDTDGKLSETPEEFDARRKRRQRQKQKEQDALNPFAAMKCGGCGEVGRMSETIIQAPSGAPVRMMVCAGCGNQLIC